MQWCSAVGGLIRGLGSSGGVGWPVGRSIAGRHNSQWWFWSAGLSEGGWGELGRSVGLRGEISGSVGRVRCIGDVDQLAGRLRRTVGSGGWDPKRSFREHEISEGQNSFPTAVVMVAVV